MNWLPILLLFVGAPIGLFLGWFFRGRWAWFYTWAIVGGLVCLAMLIAGWTAPTMDWGFTAVISWLWTAFWLIGGAIQYLRLKRRAETGPSD